jgi:hypothetical protein
MIVGQVQDLILELDRKNGVVNGLKIEVIYGVDGGKKVILNLDILANHLYMEKPINQNGKQPN